MFLPDSLFDSSVVWINNVCCMRSRHVCTTTRRFGRLPAMRCVRTIFSWICIHSTVLRLCPVESLAASLHLSNATHVLSMPTPLPIELGVRAKLVQNTTEQLIISFPP